MSVRAAAESRAQSPLTIPRSAVIISPAIARLPTVSTNWWVRSPEFAPGGTSITKIAPP